RLWRRTGSKVVVSNKWNGHRRGAPAAAAAGVPAVWWQHDVAEPTPEEVAAASLPVASVVCCSAFVGRVQRRLAPEAPIETIHSGIPVAEVAGWKGSGASVRDSLGWRGNPLVGVVGRLKELKG